MAALQGPRIGLSKKPRLLIVEDHALVAQGFKSMLSGDYEVLDIVTDGAAVLEAVAAVQPDVLLLDLSLPSRCGVDLLGELRAGYPALRVLVVTMHDDPTIMKLVIQLGAAGFVPKDAGYEELTTAIEEVLAGRMYASPRVHGHRGVSAQPIGFLRLTARQQEIVRMIARGKTSEEMAACLGVSYWTVHFHRKNIRRILGIHSDLEMHRYAVLVASCDEASSGSAGKPVAPTIDRLRESRQAQP